MKIQKILKFIFIIILGVAFFATGFYFGKGKVVIVDPSEKIDFTLHFRTSEVY